MPNVSRNDYNDESGISVHEDAEVEYKNWPAFLWASMTFTMFLLNIFALVHPFAKFTVKGLSYKCNYYVT